MADAMRRVVIHRGGNAPVLKAFPWWLMHLASPFLATRASSWKRAISGARKSAWKTGGSSRCSALSRMRRVPEGRFAQ